MSMKDQVEQRLEEGFDFGFSIMDEEELEAVQQVKQQSESTNKRAKDWEDAANTLYAMITPFLNNLAAQSEKSYIYWPNRVEKIEEFKERLNQVLIDTDLSK